MDAVLLPYQHLLHDCLNILDLLRNERLPVGWAMARIDLDLGYAWDQHTVS